MESIGRAVSLLGFATSTIFIAGFGLSPAQAQLCGVVLNCEWPVPNVAYYPFDDLTAGGDASNGVDGFAAEWQGSQPNIPVQGLIGLGSQINDEDGGINEHYSVDLSSLNGANGLTIALWFSQNVAVNSNSVRTGLFNSRALGWTLDGVAGNGGLWGVSLGSNGSSKGFDARINSSQAGDQQAADPGTGVLPGVTLADGSTFVGFPTEDQWRHVAFTWDGLTGTQRLYLDGELLGEGVDPTNIGTIDQSVGWRIGDDACCSQREFTGTLDEVGVWDAPLNDEDILSIYQAALDGIGLIPRLFDPYPVDPVAFSTIQANFFTEFGATRADGDVTSDGRS